jgi:hypothetical protein
MGFARLVDEQLRVVELGAREQPQLVATAWYSSPNMLPAPIVNWSTERCRSRARG